MPMNTRSNQNKKIFKEKKRKVGKDNSDSEETESLDSNSEYETDYDEYEFINKLNKKHKKKKHIEVDEDDDDEMIEFNRGELQSILSKIFPSKYMSERAKATQKYQNKLKKKSITPVKKNKNKNKKKLFDIDSDTDSNESIDIETDSSESIDSDDTASSDSIDSESEYEDNSSNNDDNDDNEDQLINIVLLGGATTNDEEYIEDNADCDSDDEKMFMKENFPTDISDNKLISVDNKKSKKSKINEEELVLTNVEQDYLDLIETKKTLSAQLAKKPKSKILKKAVDDCKHSIMKLVKKARNNNAKLYHKLITREKQKENEVDYFKTKLSNKEQLRVMQDLKDINKHIHNDKPYRIALLDSNMPSAFKAVAMQRINIMKMMEPGDPEFYKIKNWVDTFMKIPFGIYRNLNVHISNGIDTCNEFLVNAKKTLDDCVYGLDDAKLQIMQMMGQWVSNPSAMGSAISIQGPMGTGKTTLVKDGISKILGREFEFIALGGNSDSSFLEGHSYTYEGSTWGKIVQILINSKCMNPVIYFDELDKVSDTPKGEEIIGILTHLTDTTQNSQFHDKYFSEVEFDVSKCLFIFSYNDENKINPILKDRMYRIQTTGYENKDKIKIARNYLLPKIREQIGFNEKDVIISDDIINYIVSNEKFTNKEQGVRNLKRCLEIIHTKLNLFRLVKKDSKIINIDYDITFPVTVTQTLVDLFIKKNDNTNPSLLAMYI